MRSFSALSRFAGKRLNSAIAFLVLLAATGQAASLAQPVSTPVALIQELGSFDALVRHADPIELRRLSPYVEQRAFPYVLPAVRALHGRLRVVERVARSRGLPARHLVQLIYGSTFLRQNPVANDLDYMLGVHLGRVRLDPGQPILAAAEMISRIEEYLQVTDRVFERYRAPELVVSEFSVLEKGKLRRRDQVIPLLAASLAEVGQDKEQRLLVERRDGLGVPTVLSSRESYIHETTRIQFLSNSVRSVDWMFAGIRRLQMMFHFYFHLEVDDGSAGVRVIQDFPLHPTFIPSGRVLKLEDQLLGIVPVDSASAAFFSELALGNPERMAKTRIELARQLLADVRRNLGIGDTTKALKRLKQVQSALAPGLDPEFSARLGNAVSRYLNDDNILSCKEVAEMAQSLRLVLRQPQLMAVYGRSRDLHKTLRRIVGKLRELPRRQPRLESAQTDSLLLRTLDLIDHLEHSGLTAGDEESEVLLYALEAWGEACGLVFAPTAISVERVREKILARLKQSGIRSLPVYGLADGTVGVPEDEAARLGLQQNLAERIIAAGGPAMAYRRIGAEERPGDAKGEVLPVSDRLWLTLGNSPDERQQRQRLTTALADDGSHFGRVRRSGSVALRKRGHDLLLERFGERAAGAWASSATAGDGLLALLGTEVDAAKVLLDRHMAIVEEIDAAVGIVPVADNGDEGYRIALKRALQTTSERIIEALAVNRTSAGRSGLTVLRAKLAQHQLSLLVSVLKELAAGRGAVLEGEELGQGAATFLLNSRSGPVTVTLRAGAGSGASSAVELQVLAEAGGAASIAPLLRLSNSPQEGGIWQLVFFPDRMNWGVHGPSLMSSFEPDHAFFDGLPDAVRSPGDARADRAGEAFSRYIAERFIPAIAADR